jgi:hypothetical protein
MTAPAEEMGRKDDAGKPRLDLLPFAELEEVARVLDFGAKKYSPGNWRFVQDGAQRYLRAALSHLGKHADGHLVDEESGLLHVAHAACSALFLIRFVPKAKPPVARQAQLVDP